MKSIRKDRDREEKSEYPKLMIGEARLIVLMQRDSTGTAVYIGSSTVSMGSYSRDWDMDAFTDYTGTIELSND